MITILSKGMVLLSFFGYDVGVPRSLHTRHIHGGAFVLGKTSSYWSEILNEPVHEISNNVVCATSKASDQPLIRAFASRLSIL